MTHSFLLFDLDGTLLDSQRRIRPRTLHVLRELMARGVGVSFATGRPPRAAKPYADELQPTGPLVCMNGALVWDHQQGVALEAHRLRREVALTALTLAEEQRIHANVYVEEDIYIAARTDVSEASARKDGVEQVPVGPLPAWLGARDDAPVKILFIAAPEQLPALAAAIRQRCGDDVVLVNSEPDYLELLPDGVNKSVGLDALCRARGISPADVIAFGDNLNDLEMIQRAGLGVAMGNAHEELKAAADVVIGGNDSDAIADFVQDRFGGSAAVSRKDAKGRGERKES